ncbi:MAG: hypothetical protein AAF768_13760, partial [Pseudomonadota bacterium]
MDIEIIAQSAEEDLIAFVDNALGPVLSFREDRSGGEIIVNASLADQLALGLVNLVAKCSVQRRRDKGEIAEFLDI